MGYFIKRTGYKKSPWKVQHQSYEGGTRKIRDIPSTEWLATFGVRPGEVTEDTMRDVLKQKNAQARVKYHENRRQNIARRIEKEAEGQAAWLPDHDRLDFEKNELFKRLSEEDAARNKLDSHWRAARRVIAAVELEPKHWAKSAERFYDYFSRDHWSMSYAKKVLGVLNRYGEFLARKYERYFEQIPFPSGREKEKINDRYHEKHEDGLSSLPLTPEKLESERSNLLEEHYNWLRISVWFGLRPIEVDRLRKASGKRTWQITEEDDGLRVLHVYQSKLTSVPEKERTKPIPCGLKEQVETLEIIKSGKFRRPLTKTMRDHFGERVTCYGGRKNFTDMMLAKGQELEDISIWMGHRSIERTWASYKQKQVIRFKKSA